MAQRFALALLMLLATSGHAVASDEWEQAMQAYENGSYVEAERLLREPARGGNARAAEILGFMHAYGTVLYPGLPRNMKLATESFDAAAHGGSAVGRYMSCALQRQADIRDPGAPRCFAWIAETGSPEPQP